MVAIAKAEGFAISADELKRAQAEISDDELEGVAGGTLLPIFYVSMHQRDCIFA